MSDPLESWREEKRSAYLYEALSQSEADPVARRLFSQLGREAEAQARLWAAKITGGEPPSPYRPDLRTLAVRLLIRKLGPRPILPMLAAMKIRGLSIFARSVPHPMPASVEEVGLRHAGSGSGGNLRAAVFGVNDGLVSNASLILGIAGATGDGRTIVLSGLAGLLAGAFSMAAGEYVSVRSQRELYEYQIGLEEEELKLYPREEAKELALIYEARGMERAQAEKLADALISDPSKALDALSREELGLNPQDLGSPLAAALFSFFSFAAGALLPLLPFLVGSGARALVGTVAVTAVSLFAVGMTLSLFTGRNALWGGLRMLGIGAFAGAATYSIGKALGVSAG